MKIADPRPREFLKALSGIPVSVAAVKRLYAVDRQEGKIIQQVRYVAPRIISYRTFDEGREYMRFETNGHLSTEWRREWKAPERRKGLHVPDPGPSLARLLAEPGLWKGFGLGSVEDIPREYAMEKRTEGDVALIALSYRGLDSIGRDQSGYLYLDALTGLPRAYEEYQGTNSPRDDGGFLRRERWTLLQVTR